jgi:predicted porin
MKRTLLAIALGCVAAASSAQSAVTIYGVVDAGVGATQNGSAHSTQVMSGVANGSRLGFRGIEDLGGGLSATFLLENGFVLDNGSITQGGVFFGRQIYMGLTSTSGWSLTAGRQWSPLTNSMVAADPLNWQYWGNTVGTGLGIHESPGEGPTSGGWQANGRVNNSVLGRYTFSGLTAELMVAFGDENPQGNGQMVNAGLTYASGPLMVTGAYARFKQFAGATVAGADPQWQDQFVVGGSYDFKVAKISGGYYQYNPSNANRPAGTPNALDPRFDKSSTYWIGAKVPLPVGTLLTNFMKSTYEYATIADGKGTTFGVAYEYPLSKRTALYASYGQVDNNATGLVPLFAAIPVVLPSAAGNMLRGYGVGVRQFF